ncbi:hypothetical protein [Enterococcus timonensis]|uniref:hypothetical protein n=1 Tax=Enterococcus timonensis TaxID=1852364 RepID=UPI001319C3E5|nr:hypothetical protein [Enterococcus timonensis]
MDKLKERLDMFSGAVIAFAVEGPIAQPIARFVLLKLHQVHDADTEDLVDE